MSLREYAIVYLKGLAMGAADAVPGISGGTIALITGVYERLIQALTGMKPDLLRYIPYLYRRSARKRFFGELADRDFVFLMSLGFGAVTAVVIVSKLLHAALVSYRPQTFAFFFGLIAASTVVVYTQLKLNNLKQILVGLTGFAAAFLLTGATSAGFFPQSLPFVFLAGLIAISAMVLPGISGSFILLILGQYTYLTGVLSDFTDSLVAVFSGGGADIVQQGMVVFAFVSGAGIGILSFAHVVEKMLENYRALTMTFLVSLMAGSLRLPAEEVASGIETWTTASTAGIVLPAFIGAAAAFILDEYTLEIEDEGLA